MLSQKERELTAGFAEQYPAGHGVEYFAGSGIDRAVDALVALAKDPEILERG